MRQRFAALLWMLGAVEGCASSHAALLSCSLDGGTDAGCFAPFTCMSYQAQGPDGLCHGVIGNVCALPCQTSADCSVLGANSVCYACPSSPGVCTAYQ
jgi:hypothetical protein